MDRWQLAALLLAAALMAVWFWTLPDAPLSPAAPPAAEGPSAERPSAGAEAPAPAPGLPPAATTDAPAVVTRPPDALRHDLSPGERVMLENDALRLELGLGGGRVLSAKLKRFHDRPGEHADPVELVTWPERGMLVLFLGGGPLEGFESTPHEVESAGAHAVDLLAVSGGVHVRRTLALDPSGYGGRLRVHLENRGDTPIRPQLRLAWYALSRPRDDPSRFQNYALVGSVDGSIERTPVVGLGQPGFFDRILGRGVWEGETLGPPAEWAGVESQYFLAAAVPENPAETRSFHGPIGVDAGLTLLSSAPVEIPPGHYLERSYRLYFGPKLRDELTRVDPLLDASIQAGWSAFRPLVDLFAFLLVWTHDHVVANYGVAIVLLTILLRAVTFPLTQRSMKSMRRFGEVAPLMKEIQEKHKGDRERINQEIMALYQRTGINPITAMGGGCLPMLIQFPFLIALYFALQASIDLRHAPFVLWIDDLSAPETLFTVAGIPIRVLPLAMGGTMVLQNRLTPATNVDPQQRQMMMWMSVFFVFLFYQFPSGLVLYWFVSNLLGIAQQVWVNRQSQREKK